ncbi:KATNB1-like protein 1 [Platysternon megacephalum]|uniref:KATNB1-like protein 1 n=1 Tax=Platysternon megacephalum TaxID=55544 RepID=A0A4D9EXR7_9SAUR|nr:KATNB1-like protein 1 [Platysternon megacephalum]
MGSYQTRMVPMVQSAVPWSGVVGARATQSHWGLVTPSPVGNLPEAASAFLCVSSMLRKQRHGQQVTDAHGSAEPMELGWAEARDRAGQGYQSQCCGIEHWSG